MAGLPPSLAALGQIPGRDRPTALGAPSIGMNADPVTPQPNGGPQVSMNADPVAPAAPPLVQGPPAPPLLPHAIGTGDTPPLAQPSPYGLNGVVRRGHRRMMHGGGGMSGTDALSGLHSIINGFGQGGY